MGFAADPASRGVRDERGIALPAVLEIIMILSLAGASAIAFATQGAETSIASDSAQTAREVADSGLEAARAQL
ncbi:MAG: hypothetical protein M3Q49_21965 [Actinomycetota bacterium]|nr:hypothetical protein [Actinomycetota bacterium]